MTAGSMAVSSTSNGSLFGVRGPLAALDASAVRALLSRAGGRDEEIVGTVRDIIADVRCHGEDALRRLSRRFDGAQLEQLEVRPAAWEVALEGLDEAARNALERAAEAIATVHEAQRPRPVLVEPRAGVRIERRPVPIRRVGAYAPGGRAAYPSSVLMCVIPARVAGVEEIIVCSPPGEDGLPSPAVLAACRIAGADRLFAVGGAGAIAAMALGTDTIVAVDKVVGPGNAWVEEAKLQLAAEVSIDCPAGPSELLVMADGDAEPSLIAAEVLAQAEHDPRAAVCVLTDNRGLAETIDQATTELAHEMPSATQATIEKSMASRGALLLVGSMQEARDFANEYAPEHLLAVGRQAEAVAERVLYAGAVFLGAHSSVTFGDYASGSNHVLPTSGRARAYSGLATGTFMRWTSSQRVDQQAAAELATTVVSLADLEGLPAHAAAAARHETTTATARREEPPAPQARPNIRRLPLYAPGRRDAEVELSDNTNLFGLAPAVRAGLAELDDEALLRYPSVYGVGLKHALEQALGVGEECIATGCGSDDLLDAALRAFVEPGGALAHSEPTFSMIGAFADVNDLRRLPVAAAADLHPDLDALAAKQAAATYLCRPENPAGVLNDQEATQRLASRLDGVVLLDEAYIDFASEPSLAAWAAASRNAVVFRTFSKIAGMAGLRAGYAVGSAPVIAEIERARGPYKLNGLAERLAARTLREDVDWRRDIVDRVARRRAALSAELEKRGVRVWPSSANFVLAGVPAGLGGAAVLEAALRVRGVGVRPFPALPVGDCVRITVGPDALMQRLLAALDAVLGEVER
ncbi:MAG TPA: histidinol dehydrogenase [Acidobacteriota bacterium]|nr:histidinol dehydrogenase [Acidobacteriota bacterium]